jgi:hypothetical protein
MYIWSLFQEGKVWGWGRADHYSPSDIEVKYVWSYTSTPSYVLMTWRLERKTVSPMEPSATYSYFHAGFLLGLFFHPED